MKILSIDDHMVVREGLKRVLTAAFSVTQFDEAANGAEGLARIESGTYDIVILDIVMPEKDGFEVLEQLKAQVRKLPVLVLSHLHEEHHAVRALRMGAHGYLSKGRSVEEIVAAVRRISGGGRYLTAEVAEAMAAMLTEGVSEALHTRLSNREMQVMLMLSGGKELSEIASELYLSKSTVSTYRFRILEKMGLKNNTQLARYAIERGLLS